MPMVIQLVKLSFSSGRYSSLNVKSVTPSLMHLVNGTGLSNFQPGWHTKE